MPTPSGILRHFATLFHVSPQVNRWSIHDNGLLPAYSHGKQEVVWLANWRKVKWAIQHVAKHHGCEENDLDVWRVWVDRRRLRLKRMGVYLCTEALRPNLCFPATEADSLL